MTKITKFILATLFTLATISTTASANWFDGFNNGTGAGKITEKSVPAVYKTKPKAKNKSKKNSNTKQYKKSRSNNKRIDQRSVSGIGETIRPR